MINTIACVKEENKVFELCSYEEQNIPRKRLQKSALKYM